MMDILSPTFNNGHKYIGKANVTTATTPAEGIAPPSPRLSMDENTLMMMAMTEDSKKDELTTKPTIDTAMLARHPSSKCASNSRNFPYKSPTVQFAHDPSGYLTTRMQSLIYWEHPLQSAGVLSLILGSTWMTRYYSLLYLLSALFTVVTSFNWIYVNAHYHSHRILSGKPAESIDHPHGDRLKTQKRRTWFTEEQVDHASNVVMDLFEELVTKITDLVLIENSWKSGWAVITSFFVWGLASILSIKSIIMSGTVMTFVIPRLYLEHQVAVDDWVQGQQEKLQKWLRQNHHHCQRWLQQYHLTGQCISAGLKVCYEQLHQLALFVQRKHHQWVNQRDRHMAAFRQQEEKEETENKSPVPVPASTENETETLDDHSQERCDNGIYTTD